MNKTQRADKLISRLRDEKTDVCEIWGFHGEETSPWRWRQQDPPKH